MRFIGIGLASVASFALGMSTSSADAQTTGGAAAHIAADSGVTGVLLGVSSQMELVLLVEAGLTPAAALRCATLTPAQVLGRDTDLGAVEPNKRADILLLDADPTIDIRDIAKVHRVVKGGVVYDPARLLGTSR